MFRSRCYVVTFAAVAASLALAPIDASVPQRGAPPATLDTCDKPAVAASWAERSSGDVVARVRACIATYFGIPQAKVLPSTHLTKDLDADELDQLEIATILEEQFGIEIPDGEIDKWQTAFDILASVQARLQARRPVE